MFVDQLLPRGKVLDQGNQGLMFKVHWKAVFNFFLKANAKTILLIQNYKLRALEALMGYAFSGVLVGF